jgi:phosphohistidine swiveling domain-containing protein
LGDVITLAQVIKNQEAAMKEVPWAPLRQFREGHKDRFWFQDVIHYAIPLSPMCASHFVMEHGAMYGCEQLSLPVSKGLTYVVYDGYVYLTPIPVTDAEEMKQREAMWRGKFMDIVGNWDKYYSEVFAELDKVLQDLDRVNAEVARLPLDKLVDALDEAARLDERKEEIHIPTLYVVQACYMIFEEICRKYGIAEKEMTRFLAGTKTKMTECDASLWGLTRRAKELGLADSFLKQENMEELPAKLSQSAEGEQWLKEFNEFLKVFGHRQESGVSDYNQRTWFEYPAPALFTIKTYLMQEEVDVDEVLRQRVREREELTANALAKMKTEEEKQVFLQALKNAQKTYPYNEDHNLYIDQGGFARVRYVMLGIGRRLTQLGILGEPDDIFFLTLGELRRILNDLAVSEPVAVLTYKTHCPPVVSERKDIFTEVCKATPPVFIGSIPEKPVLDPLMIKVWGFTPDVVTGGISMEVSKRLDGFAGAPGVTEGVARVCRDVDTAFSEVMPGDLLVVPFTNASWTPLFSKIKGVVTDSGGMLAHAAIMAREYNIPAVVGTWKATRMIETGQRIRIDGTDGVVDILG